MTEHKKLTGQTIVIVGGSSGIGRAVAVAALAAGGRVVAIGRSGRAPDGVEAVTADITDAASLAVAFGGIARIDHLVITAGARVGSPKLADLAPETVRLAFEVKVFGAILAVQQALGRLAPQASITLTSGLLSRKFGAGSLLKGAVNAAIETAGKQLAKELAPRRVNVISPGVVDTDLWGESASLGREAVMTRVAGTLPVGRVGTAEELAQAYLFAMSNGFLTGAVLDVDGGGLL